MERLGLLLMVAAMMASGCRCGVDKPVPTSTDIRVEPGSVVFPPTGVGLPRHSKLVVSNRGSNSVEVQLALEGDEGFLLDVTSVALPVGGEQQVALTFSSTVAGNYLGRVTVRVGDEALHVPLSAQAIECVAPSACEVSTWDEKSLACRVARIPDGTFCKSDCVLGGHCRAGQCEGVAVWCDDENVCTGDSCVEGRGCVNEPTLSHCPEPSEPCRVAFCEADAGCGIAIAGDGTACVVGCEAGTCNSGSCVTNRPRDCDDGNPCTRDRCDAANGCVHEDGTMDCPTPSTCHAPTCSPQDGCGFVALPDGTACGRATCDGTYVCQNATCVEEPPLAGWCLDERHIPTMGASHFHTCRLMPDQTVQCWGRNFHGEVGDGTYVQRNLPTPVVGLPPVVEISAGLSYNCARTEVGEVYCWGHNSFGQVGPTAELRQRTPLLVPGLPPVANISAGVQRTCAVTKAGEVYCWGGSPGLIPNYPVPTRLTHVPKAQTVIAGDHSSCALLWNSTVACWGEDQTRGLGNGSATFYPGSPIAVQAISFDGKPLVDVIELKQIGDLVCVRLLSGESRCLWGRSGFVPPQSQPTFPDAGPWFSPVEFSLPVVGMSNGPGGWASCWVLADTSVRCWSWENSYGQLGTGDTLVPPGGMSDVSGLTNVREIATGSYHVCASLDDAGIACWGKNEDGQLGIGSTDPKYAP